MTHRATVYSYVGKTRRDTDRVAYGWETGEGPEVRRRNPSKARIWMDWVFEI